MNGSRVNPNTQKDQYQDYDIVFAVTETSSFISDKDWILNFGNPLIVQESDWNDVQSGFNNELHDFSRRYAWLMLFDDGNRIDLGIEIADETKKNFLDDKMTMTLLDKDDRLPKIPPSTDKDYHVIKPTEDKYKACCNEFWWCLNNVVKGIARDELPYVMEMLNYNVRDSLNKMVEWKIGIQTNFSVNAGKMGKYFKRYLSQELYTRYAATYSGSDYEDIWTAISTMCDLFHTLAESVAAHFGFTYRQNEEDGMREYIRMVRANEC
jgi:aminoglycoside 6-adenylyltransferase